MRKANLAHFLSGKYILFSFISGCLLSGIASCVDFTTYSDANEVVKVRAELQASDEVMIDKQEIFSADEGRIVLRVKGKLEENLPLTIDADFELSPESKILYVEKYRQFVFQSVQDSFSFQVIAQSGLPKKWTISLQDARNSNGDIVHFRVKSWQGSTEIKDLVAAEGKLYKQKDTSLVEIFVNTFSDTIFPLRIEPEIEISENGRFIGYKKGDALVFNALNSCCRLKVEAENKEVRDWKVTLRTPDSDDVNLKGGQFMVFSDCLEVKDMTFEIDTAQADAVVKVDQVTDWKNFSVLLQYEMQLPLGARMLLLEGETEDFKENKAIFEHIEDVRKFKIVSQSGREKIWKMKLDYAYQEKASVENFSFTSYRPQENIEIAVTPSSIDTLNSVIRIDVNTGVKYISESNPLYILPVLKLSEKAGIEGLEPATGGVWHLPEVAFHSIGEEYPFTIFSESGRTYEWKMVLVDKQKEKDGEAEVKNVVLHADHLPENVVFTDNVYTADAENHEIVLKLTSARFPFLLEANAYTLNISEKARLLDAGKALVFEEVNDYKTFRVEAENGTEKVWTLRVNYTRSTGTDIKSLKVNQIFPTDIAYEKQAAVDGEKAEITLQVTDASGSFPLRMDVEAELAERARVEPELKNLVFATENTALRFHVIAESGQSREWTVRLKNKTLKSDAALVEQFRAESVSPDIELGTPVVKGRDIQIPVLAGKNNFPLALDINQTVVSEDAKLSSVILNFENIGRTEVFDVTSRSGKVTNRYTVTLLDQVPASRAAEITALKLERYTPVAYRLPGTVEVEGNQVWIHTYEEITTPLLIYPEVQVSDGAKLENADLSQGFRFTALTDVQTLTVVAEDGTTRKEWQVGLKLMERPRESEAVIEQVVAKASGQVKVEPVIRENQEVILYLGQTQPVYPFTVENTLMVSPNARVEVVNKNGLESRAARPVEVEKVIQLTFNSPGDRFDVKVIAEDGNTENTYHFSLGGEKVLNNEANVVEYKIESYFPMNMPEPPLVFEPDTAQGIITVNAPGEEVFPFTLYTRVRLSAGARLEGLNASEMKFERGFQGQEFRVIAESGRVKTWRLAMKVAEKSKENSVTAFHIDSYTPEAAGLGKPEIRPAERKIVIPVTDWVKGERLTLSAAVEVSPKATTDFRATLFFQTAKDEYKFNVTAQNGEVAEWTVVPDYTFSREAEITSFRVTGGEPASVVYVPQGIIDAASKTVYVDVTENLTFPFVIATELTYSAKAEADLSGLSGNKIRFDKYQDSTLIRITAEDETVSQEWKVKLRYHFSEEADITAFNILASSPAAVRLGSPACEISPAEHIVRIHVAEWGGATNLQITPAISVSDKATHNLNGDLIFVKKTSETKTVNVVAESGKVTPWQVKLDYEENSGADITGVNYSSWAPADINFIGAAIDAKAGVVTLELQTWNGHTEFTLKDVSCKLSNKAIASIPSEMTFRKQIQESLEYMVTAQDGTQKKWTFKLLYHESGAADITRFRITGSNRPDVISMASTGDIGDGVVTIVLTSGVRDAFETGFQINVEVELSPKATSNIPASILFSKPSDQRKYTVTAESGASREWTVKFVNQASPDASLLAFRGVSLAGGSTGNLGDLGFSELNMSGNTLSMAITDVITLNKYDRNWPTLDLDLDLQLSPRAKLKEGNRVSVNVSQPGQRTLTVLADDGIHQQTYTLDVAYKPQLENWNLDSWSDGKTPAGSVWGTANNTFVSGTSKTDGKSGSAALLKTSEAVGMKAAGTIFLGYFKFTSLTDALNDPEKMTYFGVAFPAKPRQVKVDIQYKQGNGTLNDGSRDKGQVWVALEYWPDPNDAKNSRNKRYAYGEVMLTENVGSWTTYTINVNVIDASVVPTHLLIVASSSYDGNHFNAVNGSEMKIDNIELVY